MLFLVPVAFLVFMLTKVFGFMLVIAAPMADRLPVDTIGGIALATGLVKTLESKVLMKVPGYTIVKGIKGGVR